MKYKDLLVLVIKNVAKDGNASFNAQTIDDLTDSPLYGDYINNAPIAINQAIARLVTSEKILTEFIELSYSIDPKFDDKRITTFTINLAQSEVKSKIYKFKNVSFVDAYGSTYPLEFRQRKPYVLVVSKPTVSGTFIIKYARKVPQLSNENTEDGTMDLEENFGISDTLIYSFVLDYTRAKLWEIEEPELAQQYMNYAETYLQTYQQEDDSFIQEGVITSYNPEE